MASKTESGISLILLFLLVAVVAGSRAAAQDKKPMLPAHFADHVTAKFHQQTLKQIIVALDKQSGLNVLIDGEPLTPMADVECDGTLEEALNKISDTFDYNWKVGRGGIVLFNKRFRNRNDAPQANVAELTHLVQNMSGIFALTKVEPDPSYGQTLLNKFAQSITEKQWVALRAGKRMSAKDLSPDQFTHLRTAVMTSIFAMPLKSWSDLADHLRTFDTAYLTATRIPDDPAHPNVPRYGYEIFWHDRDGSLSSENILIQFFGND
jgi:hypothetical protein